MSSSSMPVRPAHPMFVWDDDERSVLYTLKPEEPSFDFRQMYKEIAREDWRLAQYDYYTSYDYEYNCEYYDYGDYIFSDIEEEENDKNNSASEEMDESEENEELLEVNKFMYT
jgi:hypothetical protein